MQLFIPTIGAKLELLQDWQPQIQNEYRNRKFWETYFGEPCPNDWGGEWPNRRTEVFRPIALPAGTILTVDRLYIRKGASDFDSITFNLAKVHNPFKTAGRFWVKLSYANGLDVKVVS